MNDSIYIARWPGLLGTLTQGDIDAECTWTEAQLESAFGDAGFDDDVCCRFAPLLMDPKCTVTGWDFSDARQCGATVEEMQRLMEFLGAPEWQMTYVLDMARGDLRDTLETGSYMGRVEAGWTEIIRVRIENASHGTRDATIDEMMPLLFEHSDAKVSRSDLLSVCWLRDFAPEVHHARLERLMARGLQSVLLYEGDTIHADYVIKMMNECIEAVARHTPINKSAVIGAFSKSVFIATLSKCGELAFVDSGWTRIESYRIDDMVNDVWKRIADTNWHELQAVIHGYHWEVIRDEVEEHCEAFSARFLADDDERVGIIYKLWARRIEDDFFRLWFSVDFRLYLPFLRNAQDV